MTTATMTVAMTISTATGAATGAATAPPPVLDRLLNPRAPRERAAAPAAVAMLTIAFLLFTSWQQDRDLIPKFHDEHMHLLQMRHLAHGRLWLAPLPADIADHFETFHVFVTPVYASIYFPGTALMYLPAVWLGLPNWVLPMLVAGACAAVLHAVVTELIDGVAGLLAALLLVSLQWFRYLAMMVMSHSVMLLLGLLLVWAWLRWRQTNRLRWAVAMGAFAGWAAITRPVDAICYALPVGIAMLFDLRTLPARRAALTVACAIVSATPFLALQVIQNVGITGHALKTPYRHYADLYTPQMSFGFHRFDETVRPRTTLPQRQDYYDRFTVPAARRHRLDGLAGKWLGARLPRVARVTTPNRLLWLLVPLGAIAVLRVEEHRRARAAVASVLLVFVAFYAMFAYLLPWYCVVVAPSVILLVLLGKAWLERVAGARRRTVGIVLTLAIVAAAVTALPGIDREVIDDGYPAPVMWFSYVEAPKAVRQPAIILFRYRRGDNINEEPVYNVDAITPDRAPIIRAHDLGPQRNQKLFAYYAARQPDRTVYLFDRASRTLIPLGNVVDLARPAGGTTTTTTTTTARTRQ